MPNHVQTSLTIVLVIASLLPLSSCDRLKSVAGNDAKPKWAHIAGQQLMGSLVGQILVAKNKIPTNHDAVTVCLRTDRGDFRAEDFFLESKLALATWFSAAGMTAENWQQLNFVINAPCTTDDKTYSSVIHMPSLESNLGSHANFYAPTTMWCTSLNDTNLNCQTEAYHLGFGGLAALQLAHQPDNALWHRIDYNTPCNTTLSPFVKWISLRDSIATSTVLEKKVRDGLTSRLDGIEKKESFEKYVELAALLEKYAVKDELTRDFPLTRAKIVANPQLLGVRVPLIPRVGSYHVLLHEIGHQFGLEHADKPPDGVTMGVADGTIHSDVVVEKNATMAYGEPLFFLTADDKAGMLDVTKAIQLNLKEFDFAQ